MKKQKSHTGISLALTIYNPRKDISEEEANDFLDEVIELVEKKKWRTGGGYHLVNINSTPKYRI